MDYDYIPGCASAHSIVGLGPARRTREDWQRFLADPGPVVIASAQGAACFGAAYEFLFNVRYQIARNHLADKAPLTYVTAEPFAAHFGIGGFGNAQAMCEWMFRHYHIHSRMNAEIDAVTADGVHLKDGEFLPSKFTMVMPRFLGVDAVRQTPGLGNANGFIEVADTYRHPVHRRCSRRRRRPRPAAGGAAACPAGCEDRLADRADGQDGGAEHRRRHQGPAAQGRKFDDMAAYCIMDTGNMGMIIAGDHMLSPRARVHHSRTGGALGEGGVREVLLWTRRHAGVSGRGRRASRLLVAGGVRR